jgi:hypothetical protein
LKTLTYKDMAKQLTAKKLLNFLLAQEKAGADLSKVVINYRADRNSDVEKVKEVEEDLFDSETNNKLESIVLITDPRDM